MGWLFHAVYSALSGTALFSTKVAQHRSQVPIELNVQTEAYDARPGSATYASMKALTPSSKAYRPDIDGLRAVSIILIIATHLRFEWATGGFVGVDIFFVISGYVIHRTLLNDLGAGSFSFSDFYWRRVRRIVPSLAVVLLATLAVGAATLPPVQFVDTADSALSALLFSSNIYFNETLGYFAPASFSIPLLHTWSLGVEEQFYIVVPLVLWLSASKAMNSRIVFAVLGVTIFSLFWCVVETNLNQQQAFYLPMSRLWELGTGGCVALFERQFGTVIRFARSIAIVGALLICSSLILVVDGSGFPGVVAALPVAGAALIILSGGSSPVGAVLSTSPAVYIGKYSYTLYLVHWPVIVFWGIAKGANIESDLPIVLALILAFALLLSWFVEQPLRRSKSPFDRG
ncbi:MAG: acyltransferase, partial [Micropepsaceae bacterium]